MSGTTDQPAAAAVGRRVGGDPAARRRPLVRRLGRGVRPALRSSWSTPARSPRSTRPSGPNSYWAHSDPATSPASRTARSSAPTDEVDAGPTNNWRDPAEMRAEMTELYTGAMQGRTMYVVPFSMGPLGSPIAHIGVQLTDSRLRRRQHADHDPHGPGRPRRARRRRVGAVRALRRRAARPTARPTCRGRATPTTSTSSTSPRPARSGRTARATAATPCSARSASPCASPR